MHKRPFNTRQTEPTTSAFTTGTTMGQRPAYQSISANALGVVAFTERGDARFQRYDKSAQAQSQQQNRRHRSTPEESLYLNMIQRSMFHRVMYGLKAYTPEQIAGFSPDALAQISRDHEKCSEVLRRLKVEVYCHDETKLLNVIFPKLKLGSRVSDYFSVKLPATATLKKLGISTQQVVERLMETKILPQNFLALSPDSLEF